MSEIWSYFTGFFATSLEVLHDLFAFTGDHSWGWAIVALTLLTRVLLLPLNVKQTKSMRAMQELAPKTKRIQQKYKVDRELMRTNPEKYKMMKAKQNEETMALYQEAGVNPAAGCLPLVAQMPIFIALFSVLRSHDNADLLAAPFYFVTAHAAPFDIEVDGVTRTLMGGLGSPTNTAGAAGWFMIVVMAATMFITQRQMMARNAPGDDAQAQQQKIMMYVMPFFLAFISLSLPLGVLVYWVTTNLWQMVQQWLMFRHLAPPESADGGKGAQPGDRGPKPSSTSKSVAKAPTPSKATRDGSASGRGTSPTGKAKKSPSGKAKQPTPAKAQAGSKRTGSHLPDRRG